MCLFLLCLFSSPHTFIFYILLLLLILHPARMSYRSAHLSRCSPVYQATKHFTSLLYMLFRQCQNIYYYQYIYHRCIFLLQKLQIWSLEIPLLILVIVCTFVAAQFQSKASNANNASCLKVCPHYFPINFCFQHLCGDILFW